MAVARRLLDRFYKGLADCSVRTIGTSRPQTVSILYGPQAQLEEGTFFMGRVLLQGESNQSPISSTEDAAIRYKQSPTEGDVERLFVFYFSMSTDTNLPDRI